MINMLLIYILLAHHTCLKIFLLAIKVPILYTYGIQRQVINVPADAQTTTGMLDKSFNVYSHTLCVYWFFIDSFSVDLNKNKVDWVAFDTHHLQQNFKNIANGEIKSKYIKIVSFCTRTWWAPKSLYIIHIHYFWLKNLVMLITNIPFINGHN